MNHYDNHANSIDYILPHKIEIVRKDKPAFTDAANLSDNELAEKLDDIEIRISEIKELYEIAKRDDTFERLLRASKFKSVICREIRKRGLRTNAELKAEVQELKEKFKDATFNPDSEKKISKLEAANNSLKGEVAAYRAKLAAAEVKTQNNTESEKTRRHRISIMGGECQKAYLLAMIKTLVGEDELLEIHKDLNEIREREIKELI